MKICSKCKQEKNESEFYSDKRRPNGLQSECKYCVKLRNEKNKEKRKQTAIKWRAKNKEYCKEHQRKWREDNRDKVREYKAKWKRENKAKVAQIVANRRAITIGAFLEDVDRELVYNRDGRICGICKNVVLDFKNDFELDHIIPLSRGGKHSYCNTQTSHSRCNHKKSDRLMEELELRYDNISEWCFE